MLNVRKILRLLSLLIIIFVFCPSFLVSCSGQDVNVDVMTAVGGVKAYGEYIAKPQPIMLICLVLPIVIIGVLFEKTLAEKKTAMIVCGCAALDTIVWIIFRVAVKKYANENYCTFKTTPWFVINIIVLLTIILLTGFVIAGVMHMDSDLLLTLHGGGTQKALSQMSSAVSQLAGNVKSNKTNANKNVIGFCYKCGTPIEYGSHFCPSCGTTVPETMIAEAEEKARQEAETRKRAAEEKARIEAEARRKAEEAKIHQESQTTTQNTDSTKSLIKNETIFCHNCGTKLRADAKFCNSCGAKVSR